VWSSERHECRSLIVVELRSRTHRFWCGRAIFGNVQFCVWRGSVSSRHRSLSLVVDIRENIESMSCVLAQFYHGLGVVSARQKLSKQLHGSEGERTVQLWCMDCAKYSSLFRSLKSLGETRGDGRGASMGSCTLERYVENGPTTVESKLRVLSSDGVDGV